MDIITGTVGWEFGSSGYSSYTPFSSNAATFDDDLYEEIDNEADLISPSVNTTSYNTITLSFEYSLEDYAGSGDFIVSVWNGTSWIQVFSQTSDMLFEAKSIDVTAYKNANFRVKFKYMDDDWGWGAGLDTYKLTGTNNLSTNEVDELKTIKIGPNPISDKLTFFTDKKVSNINIYNASGVKVHYDEDNNNTINLSQLTKGIYFITFEINGEIYKKKFIKN
ncbi:hypothetical protein ACM46_11770 [Chryseobacterium angstadtii]|uniref:Secretion system C-terminal sorting domain-containing protein n=2 Tax=Chryseobacterium angstadtii TaxID=558151 RepID=A0A0J7IFY9_9FLAO|nr:hypothetical protein ACM46_11770 [Chryseobacterium angstadtii]